MLSGDRSWLINRSSIDTACTAHLSQLAVLEKELINLIGEGKLEARLDSHKKVLYAKNTDQRLATYQKVFPCAFHC